LRSRAETEEGKCEDVAKLSELNAPSSPSFPEIPAARGAQFIGMSGVEFIVGTVLASVPITLEVYDRSGRVFEVFSVFRPLSSRQSSMSNEPFSATTPSIYSPS